MLSLSAPVYSQNGEMKSKMMKGKEMMGMAPTSATSACALRKTLNLLLAEHVYLSAMATDAAPKGNQKEFDAAAAALDANSQALAAANGSVYGQAAADAFLPYGGSTSGTWSLTPRPSQRAMQPRSRRR